MKRLEGYFRGKNDFELFYQIWSPSNAVGTLVVTHGLGEHTECYQRLVDGLKNTNLNVVSWDLRGHGRSEGKRGVVKDFTDFSQDLLCFLDHVKKNINDKPPILLGHSMGGLINLYTLVNNPQLNLKGAVFSSPLLGVQVDVPQFKKTGAKYLAEYLPSFTLWNEIKHNVLSHDKKIIEEFERDPLRHDRISPQLYLDMLKYTERVRKLGGQLELPVLFQVAGQDKVVNSRATIDFFDTVASKNKKMKIYENSFHEIYNDIEREVAFQDLTEWILSLK